FELLVVAEEGVENFLCRERRCHWQVAASHPFRECHEVRLHLLVVAGEKNFGSWLSALGFRQAGPSESRHDLRRDQLRAIAPRDFGDATKPAWRLGDHSCGALNEWLNHERPVRITTLLLQREFVFNLADALPVAAPILARVSALGFGSIEWAP